MHFDPNIDYWEDLNPGLSIWAAKGSNDPDTKSKALQAAHRLIWTRPLPSGVRFDLKLGPGTQLEWDKFRLSSDSISNSYSTNGRMQGIVGEAPVQAEQAFRYGSRIGGFILFPSYRVGGKITINGARGMFSRIADRMDLTLEAIRRHYQGGASPLADVLDRYADFFELFSDFRGYVDFWMLNDLVDSRYSVRFALPVDDYQRNAYPRDVAEYLQLMQETVRFVRARTARIAGASHVRGHTTTA